MKKLALLIIAALMVFTFSGCDTDEKVIEDEKTPVAEENVDKSDEAEENTEADEWESSFKLVEDGGRHVVVKNAGEYVNLKVKVEGNGDKSADFQWYRCDENGTTLTEYNYGHPLSMGETLTIEGIPMEEANATRYYKASAIVGNTVKNLIFTVTLVPEESELTEFSVVSASGAYEYNVYGTDETVTLSVKIEPDIAQSVDYSWYRCDENGNRLKEYNYGNPLSMAEKLEVTGIPYEEMMLPRYYQASVTVGNVTKSVVFSVTLCPMGVEVEEPSPGETDEEFMLVSEDGNYEYTIYSPDEEIVLKVTPLDTSGMLKDAWDEDQQTYLLDYCWTRCDENGTTLESHPTPVSWGQTCTVTIPWEEMMMPRYYRANAMVGNISKYVIFKVMLAPTGVEAEE